MDAMTKSLARGIVHRYLKKFSIVLKEKSAKLLDFEAAAFRGSEGYRMPKAEESTSLARDCQIADDGGLWNITSISNAQRLLVSLTMHISCYSIGRMSSIQ
jgi:hypothetical protein